MHLPCKQAHAGALPADSTSLRPPLRSGLRLGRPARHEYCLGEGCRAEVPRDEGGRAISWTRSSNQPSNPLSAGRLWVQTPSGPPLPGGGQRSRRLNPALLQKPDNSSPPGCYPGRCWCESSLSSQRLRRIANWLSVIGYSRAARSEGREIQAGCTCLENRTGASRGGGLPAPSASLRSSSCRSTGHSKPQTKGNQCSSP